MNPIILYDNILLDGTLTADDTATGAEYDVDNITDLRPYTLWQGLNTNDKYITVDIGASTGANCVGIFNHNLGTATAQIDVQHYEDGDWYTVKTINPTADTIIFSTFTAAYGTKWRLKLSSLGAVPYIGIVMIGMYLEFSYPPETPYVIDEQSIQAKMEVSEHGWPLGADVRYHPIRITPRFKFFTKTWYTTYFIPFWNEAKQLKHFFYAHDLVNNTTDIFYMRLSPNSIKAVPFTIANYVDEIALEMEGRAE